jgi:hypothetical protein
MTATITDLTTRVAERIAELRNAYANAPDPGEQTSPNAQERAYVVRSTYQSRLSRLGSAMNQLTRQQPKIDELRLTRDHLLAARIKFERILGALELLPDAERRLSWREEEAIRASLRAVCYGIEYWGPGREAIPAPLGDFLRQQGWQYTAEHGLWRGSLVDVEDQLAQRERRRDEAVAEIEAELARAV